MYLIAIAWAYVVLMMSVAEALSAQGTVLGALFTLLLYGVLPLSVLLYILGTPLRRRARQARESNEATQAQTSREETPAPDDQPSPTAQPHRPNEAPGDGVTPVGKEP